MKPNNYYNKKDDIVNSVIQKIDEAEQKENIGSKEQSNAVDKNFEITHREYVARLLESGNSTDGKVKAYIIRNTMLNCGLYFNSINDTCEATSVSRSTVKRAFNSLQEDDLIRLYQDSVWAVHPKLLRKGGGGKYIGLLRVYYSLPKREKKNNGNKHINEKDNIRKLY